MSQSLPDLMLTCSCGERSSTPMVGLTIETVLTCSSCKFEHRLTGEQIEQIDKVFVAHMRKTVDSRKLQGFTDEDLVFLRVNRKLPPAPGIYPGITMRSFVPERRDGRGEPKTDWKRYGEWRAQGDEIKAFVADTQELEKNDPDLAIARYREANARFDEHNRNHPPDLENKQIGWGDQSAIRQLAMLLRQQKRYDELIDEIEAFHIRYPATGWNENNLKRWLQEARKRLGREPSADYLAAMGESKQLAAETMERQFQGRKFPVSLVGEQHYRAAVAAIGVGDEVRIWHEPGNPYDAFALAVTDARGQTLGYLPKDCFLRRAVHDEGKGCSGTVLNLHKGERGFTQVTIEVELGGEPVQQREFSRR
jgi:hypothetical protein